MKVVDDTLIGAWDFDNYARQRKREGDLSDPPDYCHNNITKEIAARRASNATVAALLELSKIAKSKGVQLIYSNNHYNARFSPVCADVDLEAALNDSHWQILNNREISREVWKKQCPDGFHFARENIYSVEDHKKYAAERLALDGVYPGQLEMQMAQMFLFHVFQDVLSAVE